MNAEELKRVSVLVVDDEADLRSIVVGFFEEAGFSVLDAENATQALHMVRLGIVDVIVTDYNMPGPSGLELLTQIRTERANVPVFLMSADPRLKAEEVCEQGAAGFFLKPSALGLAMAHSVRSYLLSKPNT